MSGNSRWNDAPKIGLGKGEARNARRSRLRSADAASAVAARPLQIDPRSPGSGRSAAAAIAPVFASRSPTDIFETDGRIRAMIRKLKSGEYRIYSRKVDPKTGKRRNLGTFQSKEAAQKHEREIQYFKRH
ncbi:hypothetical protein [Labrys okinawensis]|nr:hypothetical protein [Labrys okinawensis]